MYQADVVIEAGKISQIAKDIETLEAEVIDAKGAYVFPGGVDPSVSHALTLDGLPNEESFSETSKEALLGGTTTIVDCAYQEIGISLKETLEKWKSRVKDGSHTDYAAHVVITDASERTLGELRDLAEIEGIGSFKVFLGFKDRWMLDDAAFFRVLQKAREIPAIVVIHPENGCVSKLLQDYAIRHDNVSYAHYAKTSPCVLEGEAIHRAVSFASLVGCPLYVSPTTCRDWIGAISGARSRDQEVFAETLLPYLVCDSLPKQTNVLPSPPLRGQADREALWSALKHGYVHAVGSGHVGLPSASQSEWGREDFRSLPKGARGIRERFGLLYTYGVEGRRITLNRFVSLIATGPSKVFGLFPKKGTIAVGSDADIVVWDPTESKDIESLGSFYDGLRIQGKPLAVILHGKAVVRDGALSKKEGLGCFIKRAKYGVYL
jgi:dihydropyrimidinase